MIGKHLTFLLLLATALAVPIDPRSFFNCNCGLGSGEDICGGSTGTGGAKKCQPLVVRPLELPKPPAPVAPLPPCLPAPVIAPLLPLGGPCSCQSALVRPAVVPKPACAAYHAAYGHQQATACATSTQTTAHHYSFGGGPAVQRPVLVQPAAAPAGAAYGAPADPISLALAYKQAQEGCAQSEGHLAFGFRQLPKDVPLYAKKAVNNIPEGDLYNLNGQIVELKKVACNKQLTLDEEAIEELAEAVDEEEAAEEAAIRQVSLAEIGYQPATIKSGLFVNVPPVAAALDLSDTIAGAVASPCLGYTPGKVVITNIPQPSPVQLPIPLPEPCASEEQVNIPPVPTFPYGAAGPYTYVSQSGTSSSSASNKCASSVLFQKLACN